MVFKRDSAREVLFNTAYGFRPRIEIKYDVNPDGTFKIFSLRFTYNDKVLILDEHYLGSTNMTNFCTVTGTEEVFKRFINAEKKIVELMKNGNSN